MNVPTDLIAPMLMQLRAVIAQMTSDQYARPIPTLHDASVGAHVRHILDMYACLDRGMAMGIVNYEDRTRDLRMETDPKFSMETIDNIISRLCREDAPLMVEGHYNASGEPMVRVTTSYQREVLYNLEHTIHHMALIRIGIEAMGIQVLPESFGVAPSTIKYKGSCAR